MWRSRVSPTLAPPQVTAGLKLLLEIRLCGRVFADHESARGNRADATVGPTDEAQARSRRRGQRDGGPLHELCRAVAATIDSSISSAGSGGYCARSAAADRQSIDRDKIGG